MIRRRPLRVTYTDAAGAYNPSLVRDKCDE